MKQKMSINEEENGQKRKSSSNGFTSRRCEEICFLIQVFAPVMNWAQNKCLCLSHNMYIPKHNLSLYQKDPLFEQRIADFSFVPVSS